MIFGAIGGMKIGRGNRSTRRKLTPAPLCPPQNPTWQPLFRIPDRSGGKPATNRLSYGAAFFVPFRRLLRLAGSRWRYSTPPPHAWLCRCKSDRNYVEGDTCCEITEWTHSETKIFHCFVNLCDRFTVTRALREGSLQGMRICEKIVLIFSAFEPRFELFSQNFCFIWIFCCIQKHIFDILLSGLKVTMFCVVTWISNECNFYLKASKQTKILFTTACNLLATLIHWSKIGISSRYLGGQTKSALYKTLVRPTPTYGSAGWPLKRQDKNMHRIFESKI
jgi:hypothetical protein